MNVEIYYSKNIEGRDEESSRIFHWNVVTFNLDVSSFVPIEFCGYFFSM